MDTMTPSSTLTDSQIDKLSDNLRSALRKHRTEFGSEVAQKALGNPKLPGALVAVFRQFVEAVSNQITRISTPNRSLTPEEMLNATGRRQYIDKNVVKTIPRGEGDGEVVMTFFKPRPEAYRNGFISDDRLAEKYDFHGLKPDPYAQAKVNEDDPAFADEHPNGTHWKDERGQWYCVAFNRWNEERNVNVNRNDNDWNDNWCFGGVSKSFISLRPESESFVL